MTEIYAISLVTDKEFEELKPLFLKLVPLTTGLRIERYARSRDAQRSLLGEVMARHLLHRATGKSLPEIPFTTGEKGKPVPDGFAGIHINISHSGDWVVVALSPTPVGVDVEKMKKVPEGVAKRFFSISENKWLNSIEDENEKAHIFFTLWTLKESFLKAIGKGLTKNLNSFTIKHTDSGNYILENDPESAGFKLKTYPLVEGYKLSVCTADNNFCEKVVNVKIKDLIEKYE
ncbi:MAG: 4'-phosphopantetheinyl transferase superfamily protein [Lentimicrobium sp.]|nr:4'-phosphopantetheinyl transferase superfamily protein [Lentimicrobium sp.]